MNLISLYINVKKIYTITNHDLSHHYKNLTITTLNIINKIINLQLVYRANNFILTMYQIKLIKQLKHMK